MQYAMRHRGQVATASGLDVLLGIWLIISPFVLGFRVGQAVTNNIILGILIGVIAAIRFFGAYGASWLSWINAILGLWVLLTPWILGFSSHRVPSVNNIVVGAVVIVLASWSALASDTDAGGRDYRDVV